MKPKILNSICEIIKDNEIKGLGFLVSLPINIKDRYLYGLLTTNETLSKQDLQTNNEIKLNFKEIKLVYNYTISENTFVFTCPFINVSFVEIPLNTINNVNYLRVLEVPSKEHKISVCQTDENGNIKLCECNSSSFFGTYILYNIDDRKKKIVNASPIVSLSESFFGDLIAINTIINYKEKAYCIGININIILRAIRALVHQNKITKEETLSEPKKLSQTEIHVLKKEGLIETENPNIFISPGSAGITPLWFCRTHYAWFWTPSKPITFSLNDLKMVNWSLIQPNFPIKAIGGIWNNAEPAERNVILIQFLINSGLRFLMPLI